MRELLSIMIPFVGLDHIVLRTQHVGELLCFYRDKLGCALERTVEEIGLYQLRAGDCLIDVIDATLGGERGGPGETLYDHFCLRVASGAADDLSRELDRLEIPHENPVRRYGATGYGLSIYATDPDGRTVEFKFQENPTASSSAQEAELDSPSRTGR